MDNQTAPNLNPEVSPTPVVPTPPVIPMVKANWTMSFVFLLLGILIGVGGLWGYQTYFSQTTIQPVSYSTPSPVPTATTDPTANWKTYSNTAYNYSIKYPTNLTIGESGMGGGDIQKATAVVVYDSTNKIESPRLAVTVRFDKDTLSNIANKHYQKLTTNLLSATDKETASKNLGYTLSDNKAGGAITATTFSGFPAFQYSIIGSVIDDGLSEYSVPSEEHDYIWFEANQKFYLISFTKTDMMSQILSTFKFTQ